MPEQIAIKGTVTQTSRYTRKNRLIKIEVTRFGLYMHIGHRQDWLYYLKCEHGTTFLLGNRRTAKPDAISKPWNWCDLCRILYDEKRAQK